ncbi:MAG: FxsA family protein [Thermoguttaceae bacterium]
MVLRLFLLFTLLPLAELAILVWIRSISNWGVTLAILFLPGLVGVWLVHREGLHCYRAVREQIARRELPAAPLLDGLLILLAAVLLVSPGLLSDLVAVGLLVPPIRRCVRRLVARKLQARVVAAFRGPVSGPAGPSAGSAGAPKPPV